VRHIIVDYGWQINAPPNLRTLRLVRGFDAASAPTLTWICGMVAVSKASAMRSSEKDQISFTMA